MNKKLPGGRFRIFLAVLGVCLATGIILSYFEQGTEAGPRGESGTLERLAVASGTANLNVDMSRYGSKAANLQFALSQDAMFAVLVYNDEFRGPLPGSIDLSSQSEAPVQAKLAASLRQLAIESTHGGEHEFIIRDAHNGFPFFGIAGQSYNYNAAEHSLAIDGRLVLTQEYAAALGREADRGTTVGTASINATMRPVEITQITDGEVTAERMPPIGGGSENGTNPGPDVVVGDLNGIDQFGSAGTQVGVAIGTDSCNFGQVDLDWFALPSNDHPVIPQNLYRMSGGTTNDARFEQIGQSQMKHAFTALTGNTCGLGCNGVGGSHLGSGCSDPYGSGLNAGPNLGSRAWVNPFTGVYPRGDSQTPPNSHGGHSHNGVSHRIIVEGDDLNPSLNPGATFYGEAQYITPHEFTWCSTHPGTCIADSGSNTFNNASSRKVNVSGSGTNYNFSWNGATLRKQPAITQWAGATITRIEPAPGQDGAFYIAYKVTNPTAGVYHYEYAIYNLNLDRGIQSLTIPVGSGVTKSNVGFHAPPQHPGWAADGTVNNQGYSSTPWVLTENANSSNWSTTAFAQDPNANACRWGTLYNIRFDSDREPSTMFATVGFYKTGNPIVVQVQGPSNPAAPWPCNSRRRNGVPLPNCG
jgi:hypothetical protein